MLNYAWCFEPSHVKDWLKRVLIGEKVNLDHYKIISEKTKFSIIEWRYDLCRKLLQIPVENPQEILKVLYDIITNVIKINCRGNSTIVWSSDIHLWA